MSVRDSANDSPLSGLRHLRARLRSSWAWARLDREIAAGTPIAGSEARSLRAAQLLVPEERGAIAAALQNILDAHQAQSVRRGRRVAGAGGPPAGSRPGLVDLITLLRSDVPMSPRALALAELLACDRRTSPLLTGHAVRTIDEILNEISAAG